MMMSLANTREVPYWTSSQVIGLPSSHVTPSFSVNSHTEESSLGVPVSVARSATGVLATSGSSDIGNATRPRYSSRRNQDSSTP